MVELAHEQLYVFNQTPQALNINNGWHCVLVGNIDTMGQLSTTDLYLKMIC